MVGQFRGSATIVRSAAKTPVTSGQLRASFLLKTARHIATRTYELQIITFLL